VRQETTEQTGYTDIPTYLRSAQDEAAQADFSIEDYGRVGDQRPYQIVQPAYQAPRFLQRFSNLEEALQECETLCTLQGRPFRVVRWGREGSGARGGVRCQPCRVRGRIPRFPDPAPPGSGCLHGYPNALPLAEFQPGGRRIVFDKCGDPTIVGEPNFVVSRTPFPRVYDPKPLPQRYLEAVKSAQILSSRTGRRTYICSSFGASCDKRNTKRWIPVVYVDPGGLRQRYDTIPTGTVNVKPITQSHFRELVAQSKGATLLGQGA
jgi:hypothetical protein